MDRPAGVAVERDRTALEQIEGALVQQIVRMRDSLGRFEEALDRFAPLPKGIEKDPEKRPTPGGIQHGLQRDIEDLTRGNEWLEGLVNRLHGIV